MAVPGGEGPLLGFGGDCRVADTAGGAGLGRRRNDLEMDM